MGPKHDLLAPSSEGPAGCAALATVRDRGNALPVLNEIRHALERLLDAGEETVIDLRSLPMGPADEEVLSGALGVGEIEAQVDALGRSVVRETAIGGVWVVEHFNGDGDPVARFIEVTRMPAILQSHPEEVRAGLQLLTERLAAEG